MCQKRILEFSRNMTIPGNHVRRSSMGITTVQKVRSRSSRTALSPRGAQIAAIVLGGSQNALSVALNLGRYGIRVVGFNYSHEPIRFSRYAQYIDGGRSPEDWARFLLGRESDHLQGSVLLAC